MSNLPQKTHLYTGAPSAHLTALVDSLAAMAVMAAARASGSYMARTAARSGSVLRDLPRFPEERLAMHPELPASKARP